MPNCLPSWFGEDDDSEMYNYHDNCLVSFEPNVIPLSKHCYKSDEMMLSDTWDEFHVNLRSLDLTNCGHTRDLRICIACCWENVPCTGFSVVPRHLRQYYIGSIKLKNMLCDNNSILVCDYCLWKMLKWQKGEQSAVFRSSDGHCLLWLSEQWNESNFILKRLVTGCIGNLTLSNYAQLELCMMLGRATFKKENVDCFTVRTIMQHVLDDLRPERASTALDIFHQVLQKFAGVEDDHNVTVMLLQENWCNDFLSCLKIDQPALQQPLAHTSAACSGLAKKNEDLFFDHPHPSTAFPKRTIHPCVSVPVDHSDLHLPTDSVRSNDVSPFELLDSEDINSRAVRTFLKSDFGNRVDANCRKKVAKILQSTNDKDQVFSFKAENKVVVKMPYTLETIASSSYNTDFLTSDSHLKTKSLEKLETISSESSSLFKYRKVGETDNGRTFNIPYFHTSNSAPSGNFNPEFEQDFVDSTIVSTSSSVDGFVWSSVNPFAGHAPESEVSHFGQHNESVSSPDAITTVSISGYDQHTSSFVPIVKNQKFSEPYVTFPVRGKLPVNYIDNTLTKRSPFSAATAGFTPTTNWRMPFDNFISPIHHASLVNPSFSMIERVLPVNCQTNGFSLPNSACNAQTDNSATAHSEFEKSFEFSATSAPVISECSSEFSLQTKTDGELSSNFCALATEDATSSDCCELSAFRSINVTPEHIVKIALFIEDGEVFILHLELLVDVYDDELTVKHYMRSVSKQKVLHLVRLGLPNGDYVLYSVTFSELLNCINYGSLGNPSFFEFAFNSINLKTYNDMMLQLRGKPTGRVRRVASVSSLQPLFPCEHRYFRELFLDEVQSFLLLENTVGQKNTGKAFSKFELDVVHSYDEHSTLSTSSYELKSSMCLRQIENTLAGSETNENCLFTSDGLVSGQIIPTVHTSMITSLNIRSNSLSVQQSKFNTKKSILGGFYHRNFLTRSTHYIEDSGCAADPKFTVFTDQSMAFKDATENKIEDSVLISDFDLATANEISTNKILLETKDKASSYANQIPCFVPTEAIGVHKNSLLDEKPSIYLESNDQDSFLKFAVGNQNDIMPFHANISNSTGSLSGSSTVSHDFSSSFADSRAIIATGEVPSGYRRTMTQPGHASVLVPASNRSIRKVDLRPPVKSTAPDDHKCAETDEVKVKQSVCLSDSNQNNSEPKHMEMSNCDIGPSKYDFLTGNNCCCYSSNHRKTAENSLDDKDQNFLKCELHQLSPDLSSNSLNNCLNLLELHKQGPPGEDCMMNDNAKVTSKVDNDIFQIPIATTVEISFCNNNNSCLNAECGIVKQFDLFDSVQVTIPMKPQSMFSLSCKNTVCSEKFATNALFETLAASEHSKHALSGNREDETHVAPDVVFYSEDKFSQVDRSVANKSDLQISLLKYCGSSLNGRNFTLHYWIPSLSCKPKSRTTSTRGDGDTATLQPRNLRHCNVDVLCENKCAESLESSAIPKSSREMIIGMDLGNLYPLSKNSQPCLENDKEIAVLDSLSAVERISTVPNKANPCSISTEKKITEFMPQSYAGEFSISDAIVNPFVFEERNTERTNIVHGNSSTNVFKKSALQQLTSVHMNMKAACHVQPPVIAYSNGNQYSSASSLQTSSNNYSYFKGEKECLNLQNWHSSSADSSGLWLADREVFEPSNPNASMIVAHCNLSGSDFGSEQIMNRVHAELINEKSNRKQDKTTSVGGDSFPIIGSSIAGDSIPIIVSSILGIPGISTLAKISSRDENRNTNICVNKCFAPRESNKLNIPPCERNVNSVQSNSNILNDICTEMHPTATNCVSVRGDTAPLSGIRVDSSTPEDPF